ncbi:hypothetical protein ACGTJS_10705 [Faucicola mancuniensis]
MIDNPPPQLSTAFENAVDEYLAMCDELGKSPNQSLVFNALSRYRQLHLH